MFAAAIVEEEVSFDRGDGGLCVQFSCHDYVPAWTRRKELRRVAWRKRIYPRRTASDRMSSSRIPSWEIYTYIYFFLSHTVALCARPVNVFRGFLVAICELTGPILQGLSVPDTNCLLFFLSFFCVLFLHLIPAKNSRSRGLRELLSTTRIDDKCISLDISLVSGASSCLGYDRSRSSKRLIFLFLSFCLLFSNYPQHPRTHKKDLFKTNKFY